MVRVFKYQYFNVYQDNNNKYIIHNTHKPFECGHTHLTNFHTTKYLIKLAYTHVVPKQLPTYLIDSLVRISLDDGYINKLNKLKQKELKTRKNKKTWH